MPIGAFPSQPIGNFTASSIDHHMKEKMHCKCYLRYCDDTMGLARSKAEAWKMVNEYVRLSDEKGLVVKAGIIVAPIAHVEYGRKKHRKRQSGQGKRQKH